MTSTSWVTRRCLHHGAYSLTIVNGEGWSAGCPKCKEEEMNDFPSNLGSPGLPSVAKAVEEATSVALKAVALSKQAAGKVASDGSTASYYELPPGAAELQDLISHRNMNAQIGEIFRACYRLGMVAHSPEIRDVKKIIFYATAELKRLESKNANLAQKEGADSSAP